MEILDKFFENLSYRLCNETRLSDITWSLLSTSECFQNIFLKYCFELEITIEGSIIREYNRNGSIPDFFFTDLVGNEYIIENKIYDRGDHFEQYSNEFPKAKRAFIANYKESNHDGWHIKNWKEFIILLENIVNEKKMNKNEQELICSYLVYLKLVTHFWEAKTMNFSNLSSLSSFYGILSEIIEEFGFQSYNIPSAINSEYFGQYFYYSNKGGKNVYIWLGLYLPEESGLYIKFQNYQNESWLPKTEQKKIKKLTTGEYFDNASDDSGNFYIHLKNEYYEKLCSNIDVNIQKDLIKIFLEEIINVLK
jgi:hypothetical protein